MKKLDKNDQDAKDANKRSGCKKMQINPQDANKPYLHRKEITNDDTRKQKKKSL